MPTDTDDAAQLSDRSGRPAIVTRTYWLDVSSYLASKQQPVIALERALPRGLTNPKAGLFSVAEVARTGEYWVPSNHVDGSDVQWSVTKTGDYVQVPLNRYATATRSRSHVFALGITLGASAVLGMMLKSGKRPVTLITIMGTTVDPVGDCYHAYAGFALKLD